MLKTLRSLWSIGKAESVDTGELDYLPHDERTLARDGLEAGSPLEVYRPGYTANEGARSISVEVPDRVIAKLVVVRADTEASVAVVMQTDVELKLGDRFRGADLD